MFCLVIAYDPYNLSTCPACISSSSTLKTIPFYLGFVSSIHGRFVSHASFLVLNIQTQKTGNLSHKHVEYVKRRTQNTIDI